MEEIFDYSYSWAEMTETVDGQNDCNEVTDMHGDHETRYQQQSSSEQQRWDSVLREELSSYEVTDMPEERETRYEDQSSNEQQRWDSDPKEGLNRNSYEVRESPRYHETRYEHRSSIKQQRWDNDLREGLNRNSYEVTDMPGDHETRYEHQSSSEQQRQDGQQLGLLRDLRERLNRNSYEVRESPRYHETRYQHRSSRKQQRRVNDLREGLSRNSYEVRESPRYHETRYQHQSASKQQRRDNDLREGLNRNRRADNRSRRELSSENDRYRPNTRNMSPLRSPINRDRDVLVVNVDGSNNCRFTNRQRELAQTTFAEDSSSGCFISPLLPGGVEELALNVDNLTSFGSGHTGSRRKLHLPSEKDDDIRSLADTKSEEFKTKMARREKDIAYGKNNDSYKMYIEIVPIHKRSSNMQEHPRTPNKYRDCSRRSWDSQVRTWKRKVHMWAETYMKKNNSSVGKPQKSSNSEATVPSAHMDDNDSCQLSHDVARDGKDEDNIDFTSDIEAEQSEVI